jgi:hypothetical protein
MDGRVGGWKRLVTVGSLMSHHLLAMTQGCMAPLGQPTWAGDMDLKIQAWQGLPSRVETHGNVLRRFIVPTHPFPDRHGFDGKRTR